MSDGSERRQYFRIDDDVYFDYRVLDEAEYRAIAAYPPEQREGVDSMVAQLRELSVQGGNMLATIRKTDPELAQYLALLERKVDLVTRLLESERFKHDAPNTRINISAGGVGFYSAAPLEAGSPLELRVIFFPSYLALHAYGRVVYSRPRKGTDPEQAYRIGVKFTLLAEVEREALVRHIFARQSADLRRARQPS